MNADAMTDIKITQSQADMMARFTKGTTMVPCRTAVMTKADAVPLIAKGWIHPTPKVCQFGAKEWTITTEGAAIVARMSWSKRGHVMIDGQPIG